MTDEIYSQFLLSGKVTTDTRKLEEGSIFFALKGPSFNGNLFAKLALDSGCSMAVVDEEVGFTHPNLIRVKNVLEALQGIALLYRRSLKIPFLAITGSNGKTTTKELVRDVLQKKFKVHATKGNLNNHIGIPLTILSIPKDCEFAVIEMGANHQNEIKSYCEYSEPDFGLITNIGKAHLEGFGGIEGVKKGKKELYDYLNQHGGYIFCNTELDAIKEITTGLKNLLPFGYAVEGFRVNLMAETPAVVYSSELNGERSEYHTNLAGGFNLQNIISAIAIGRYFGVQENKIHEAITEYNPENNRSQIVQTSRNKLIMDAYNANPSSLENALISLSHQKNADCYFVIGDMLELGIEGEEEHRKILKKINELELEGITVGPIFYALQKELGTRGFHTNEEARAFLEQTLLNNKLILIKGSRGIRLEEVVTVL
jgi:UDP-N-acetylmuramoyl-tripeptide--D-alanyl-D-alanine ligase